MTAPRPKRLDDAVEVDRIALGGRQAEQTLLERAERGWVVVASLTARPAYSWIVNGAAR
jgi:hypothetical protein